MKKTDLIKLLNNIRDTSNKIRIAIESNESYNIINLIKTLQDKLNKYNFNDLATILEDKSKDTNLLIKKLQNYDEDSINRDLEKIFEELLFFWRTNNLIEFKDYLKIKINELNFYIWNPFQFLWFNVQDEVNFWYRVYVDNETWKIVKGKENMMKINKLSEEERLKKYPLKMIITHPFWEEIIKYNLEKIFLDWSDYCDQDLASEIIQNIDNLITNI